jgi:hypothetical protein
MCDDDVGMEAPYNIIINNTWILACSKYKIDMQMFRIHILENANGKEASEVVSEMKSVTIAMLVRQMWKWRRQMLLIRLLNINVQVAKVAAITKDHVTRKMTMFF